MFFNNRFIDISVHNSHNFAVVSYVIVTFSKQWVIYCAKYHHWNIWTCIKNGTNHHTVPFKLCQCALTVACHWCALIAISWLLNINNRNLVGSFNDLQWFVGDITIMLVLYTVGLISGNIMMSQLWSHYYQWILNIMFSEEY